ncbi:MAG: isochorismatase family protein [Prolixibacteraceae bacterium]|jgi:nicotinamidase-related amidase|nr:isochorismatase family protein [Prolixibacteraceae bacterium]
MRIIRENCIGLVIDIQEKLFPVIAEKEALAVKCRMLIEGMQVLNVPMVVTQQYTKGLGPTISEISSLFDPFYFIEKVSFSCFEEPTYLNALEQSGKRNVLICGIESHVCVLQTAIDLMENGYHPIVISDCISSRNLNEKEIALRRFALEGIRVSTVESILFELTRHSTAAEFRAISKLVK